jgi:hypothetical protein
MRLFQAATNAPWANQRLNAPQTGTMPRHGYMDGAVRSGERAAKEVLAAL